MSTAVALASASWWVTSAPHSGLGSTRPEHTMSRRSSTGMGTLLPNRAHRPLLAARSAVRAGTPTPRAHHLAQIVDRDVDALAEQGAQSPARRALAGGGRPHH